MTGQEPIVGIAWLATLAAFGFACAGQSGGGSQPAVRSVADGYTAGGQRISVRIALDELGVLAKPGIAPEAIQGLARQLDASVATSYPGGLYILRLDEATSREGMMGEVRQIKEDERVGQAGLVLYTREGEPPQLATDELVVQFASGADRRSMEQLHRERRTSILAEDPSGEGRYVLQLHPESTLDALQVAELYGRSPLVSEAFPNLIQVFVDN